MNTKRVTAMRHRRPTRRTEKEKERDCVIEAAALAAAKATVEAMLHQEEDDEQLDYYCTHRSGLYGNAAFMARLAREGRNTESHLAEYIRRELFRKASHRIVPIKKAEHVQINSSVDEGMHLLYKDYYVKKREIPELPVMTKVALSALSDRMYAVTLEEMQEELYDDAE